MHNYIGRVFRYYMHDQWITSILGGFETVLERPFRKQNTYCTINKKTSPTGDEPRIVHVGEILTGFEPWS